MRRPAEAGGAVAVADILGALSDVMGDAARLRGLDMVGGWQGRGDEDG